MTSQRSQVDGAYFILTSAGYTGLRIGLSGFYNLKRRFALVVAWRQGLSCAAVGGRSCNALFRFFPGASGLCRKAGVHLR